MCVCVGHMHVSAEDISGWFPAIALTSWGQARQQMLLQIFPPVPQLQLLGRAGKGMSGLQGWHALQAAVGQGLGGPPRLELAGSDVGFRPSTIGVGLQAWRWQGCCIKVWGKSNFKSVLRKDLILGREIIFVQPLSCLGKCVPQSSLTK